MEKITNLSDFKKKRVQELLKETLIRDLRFHGMPAKDIPEGVEVKTRKGSSIITIGYPKEVSE